MEGIRQNIISRIDILELLRQERSTPLLQRELNNVIKWHCEALNNSDASLEDLDVLFKQFKEHWTKVYSCAISKATLSRDIALFHEFLVRQLLNDYANEPYEIKKWVADQAGCMIDQDGHARAKDSNMESAYSVHVIYPLNEMMLSRDHVEQKLRAAVGAQGNDIQAFIIRRDWSSLTTAVAYDYELLHKLSLQMSYNVQLFNEKTYERILQGIDEMKRRYSIKISSALPQMSWAGKAPGQSNTSGFWAFWERFKQPQTSSRKNE